MEEHLIKEIAGRLRRMPACKRTEEVREFMGSSAAHWELMEKAFPELYRESISPTSRPSPIFSPQSARRRTK
jgi:hypothetical protein